MPPNVYVPDQQKWVDNMTRQRCASTARRKDLAVTHSIRQPTSLLGKRSDLGPHNSVINHCRVYEVFCIFMVALFASSMTKS